MSKTKILLIASLGKSLVNFRGDFIKELIYQGYEVYCTAPRLNANIRDTLSDIGAKTIPVNMSRTGLNPVQDLKTFRNLKQIMVDNHIDLVFPYTIKPVIYGSLAAKSLGVPTISLITGLGMTFSGVTFKYRMLQKVTEFMYRKALASNRAVIFQNPDDLKLFLDEKIVSKTQSLHVVNGSGVHLERFGFRLNEKEKNSIVKFVMLGRLLKSKGTEYYLEAAKHLKKIYTNAEFHLIGASPKDNTGVSEELLQKYHEDGIVINHGPQSNIPPLLTKMDVFVLASYLREGIPRSILEALSIGMPVITTEMPGCKETVEPYKNAYSHLISTV